MYKGRSSDPCAAYTSSRSPCYNSLSAVPTSQSACAVPSITRKLFCSSTPRRHSRRNSAASKFQAFNVVINLTHFKLANKLEALTLLPIISAAHPIHAVSNSLENHNVVPLHVPRRYSHVESTTFDITNTNLFLNTSDNHILF